jgi:hypothetical protein
MIKNVAILALINGTSSHKLSQRQNVGVRFIDNAYEQAAIAENPDYLQLSAKQKEETAKIV